RLTGNAYANTLTGFGGNDTLLARDGNDILDGGAGDDVLDGGRGNDTYRFSRGFGRDAIRELDLPTGNNRIVFDDTVAADEVYFCDGYLRVRGTADRLALPATDIAFADGTTLTSSLVAIALAASFSHAPSAQDDTLEGTAGSDNLDGLAGRDFVYGFDGDDTLSGGADDDRVYGGNGADVLAGDSGNDLLWGNDGNDSMDGGDGHDAIHGHAGDDTLAGGEGLDTLYGDDGNDTIDGGAERDTLYGGDGNDVIRAGASGLLGGDTLDGGAGNDRLIGSERDDALAGGEGDDILDGGVGNDFLFDDTGNNTLCGGDGDDRLQTGVGADTLDGGAGTDFLSGAAGIDTYVLNEGIGSDWIAEWWGSSELTVVAIDDTLTPNDVALARLNNASGDYLQIALRTTGDELKVGSIDVALPNLEIRFGDGTVWNAAAISDRLYVRHGTPDNDVLVGGIGPDRLYGYAGSDTLTGLAGNDLLDGGTGADTLTGGPGQDTFVVDDAGDLAIEAAAEGLDGVQSSVSYVLPVNVDNLTLTGAAAVNATGNTLDNTLTGNTAANILDGKAGRDAMSGGAGNDTYVVDSTGDTVTELANQGTDLVQASIAYTLAADLEQLTLTGAGAITGTGNARDNVLTGNGGANTLTGLAGNDQLNGGAGADTLRGGAGNDTYIVDHASDVVTESAGEGTDTVLAGVTYTLASNVENLTLTGSGAVSATGNTLANTLTGNAGANTLNGGAGADTLRGGTGNDTYVVDVATDAITENAGEGTDTVQSAITWTLGAQLENLTLTGATAINATGNTLANTLTGNGGANTLDGGAGTDTLRGGAGNDTYVVDVAADVIIENAGEGTDLVQSAITLTLAANVENLTLTGSAHVNATGNTLNNTLTGNSGDNMLSGGAGADTLRGGAGNDTYVIDNAGDVVTEAASAGTDLVNASITHTLAANVEYLTLAGVAAINATGNTIDNWLRGNTAVNTLSGMDGHDTLWGDLGNDILAGHNGNDLVQGGAGNDALTDTAGNNLLDGGAGADTLSGGAGREMLIGGAGNDTLTTGGGADVIGFNKGGGADVVNASVGTDDTLSLGGALAYSDLKLRKSGLDLILDAGSGDQITFKSWYQAGFNHKSVLNLQVVADAMAAYDPASPDPMLNKKVVNFNFTGLVNAFDAALVANPAITSWNLTNALAANRLSGSDTAAIGGDFAYDYGHRSSLATIGATPAQSVLAAATFATAAQVLQPAATLYSGTVRLQ
ncbi:MAG: hypothetical protein IT518_22720, partial [Burkholderiales bacterium]|nr:hypothetical protein [Burkholderiales bacterium]